MERDRFNARERTFIQRLDFEEYSFPRWIDPFLTRLVRCDCLPGFGIREEGSFRAVDFDPTSGCNVKVKVARLYFKEIRGIFYARSFIRRLMINDNRLKSIRADIARK